MLPIAVHDRFLVMYAYGGIYIDADIVLRQPISHLRNALSFEDGMCMASRASLVKWTYRLDPNSCGNCFCWFAVLSMQNIDRQLPFCVSMGSYGR
jgi:hypothetical protein